jgi:hypothetical protein
MTKRAFNIIRLEERIAPSAKPEFIPSVRVADSAVNGAEHGLKGLSNNHSGGANAVRHGYIAPPSA